MLSFRTLKGRKQFMAAEFDIWEYLYEESLEDSIPGTESIGSAVLT